MTFQVYTHLSNIELSLHSYQSSLNARKKRYEQELSQCSKEGTPDSCDSWRTLIKCASNDIERTQLAIDSLAALRQELKV